MEVIAYVKLGSDAMAYKEIVTKAIIGKGKKKYKNSYQVEALQEPSTILGCWIINHNFSGRKDGNKIIINGTFDANIWYSYDNDTKTNVITKSIVYQEEERLNLADKEVVNEDIIIRSLKQPTCISARENGNLIDLEIEKELGVEIIGDTKVKVSSVEEEDTWDMLDNETEEEISSINTEYIKDNQ